MKLDSYKLLHTLQSETTKGGVLKSMTYDCKFRDIVNLIKPMTCHKTMTDIIV